MPSAADPNVENSALRKRVDIEYQAHGALKKFTRTQGLGASAMIRPVLSGATQMTDVTQILSQIEQGDPGAAELLLPLVYDELRKLAAVRLAQERPGQTLQATALVHDAYIRLVDAEKAQHWASRGHFFAAAARAMRRILIESARRRQLAPRADFEGLQLVAAGQDSRLLELHDALERLAVEEPTAARIVETRVFAGLSVEEAANALGLSRATAYREWTFARAWLAAALGETSQKL